MPVTTKAADEGEAIQTPVSYKTYTFTPGKLTGKEFWLEDIEKKDKILCREFSFEQFLIYKKPAETVSVRLSLRGGYTSFNILGHTNFQLDASANVTSGWVPQSSGNFLIYPDESKEHLPKWTPESTRLIRVPLIKQYGDKAVNAYDIALGLDRVNIGQLKTIDFQLIPITDDSGKKGVRLVPAKPLTDGVYYAYSLPDKIDTDIYGFLFAAGTPASGLAIPQTAPEQSATPENGFPLVDAKLAQDVLEYAQLSAAVYEAPLYKPVGEWKMLDAELNCPAGVNLDSTACSWESPKIEPNGEHGFYAQAYINKNAKKIVIAFRGTELSDLRDWLADYQNAYLKGIIPTQYQDALKFTETIIERIDKASLGYKIILTGHSLGGGLASYAAIRLSRPSVSSVVFNPAGLGEGITSAIKSLSDTQIAQIKSQMNQGLSPEFQYLSDMLNTLISDAKHGINIPSITNIHLVGDPVALFPGQQAGVFTLLTVPPYFVWYDDSGKKIQQFSTVASFVKIKGVDTAFLPGIDKIIPDGWFAPLVGDATYTKLLISDYTKLLADHKGIDVRSLPVEPHWMTNVINALKAQASIK